jgi:hypothetical protein
LFLLQRQDHASTTGAAFEGELGFYANYQISARWTLHAGYDFLFLRGLATAPQQFNFSKQRTEIGIDGYEFMTGGSLGFEFVF